MSVAGRAPFVHPLGRCESTQVGDGTRVGAFAYVLPGTVIGRDCNIGGHVLLEDDVVLGDRVTVEPGAKVSDGVRLEDDVFVGFNTTFSKDRLPRNRHHSKALAKTVVRRGASIGANATILPGITIGPKAMVGPGAVVTHNVPPHAVVVGNPARMVGYADSNLVGATARVKSGEVKRGSVSGVTLVRIPVVEDLRGALSVIEFEQLLPFTPRRAFFVYDVPSEHLRGEHAHRECHQFLVCVKGSCSIMTDDGHKRDEWQLDELSVGLHVQPMVWAAQYKYSADAILMVFASHPYDAADYIRDYEEFCALVGKTK